MTLSKDDGADKLMTYFLASNGTYEQRKATALAELLKDPEYKAARDCYEAWCNKLRHNNSRGGTVSMEGAPEAAIIWHQVQSLYGTMLKGHKPQGEKHTGRKTVSGSGVFVESPDARFRKMIELPHNFLPTHTHIAALLGVDTLTVDRLFGGACQNGYRFSTADIGDHVVTVITSRPPKYTEQERAAAIALAKDLQAKLDEVMKILK